MQTIGDRGNLLKTKKSTRFSVQRCALLCDQFHASDCKQSVANWSGNIHVYQATSLYQACVKRAATSSNDSFSPNYRLLPDGPQQDSSSLWLRTEVHDLSLTNLSSGCCYCYYFLLANLKVKVLKVKSFCYVLMLHSLPTGGHCVTHVFGTPQTRWAAKSGKAYTSIHKYINNIYVLWKSIDTLEYWIFN